MKLEKAAIGKIRIASLKEDLKTRFNHHKYKVIYSLPTLWRELAYSLVQYVT